MRNLNKILIQEQPSHWSTRIYNLTADTRYHTQFKSKVAVWGLTLQFRYTNYSEINPPTLTYRVKTSILQVYTFPALLHTTSINTVFFNFKLRFHYAVSGKENFRVREKAQYNKSLNQKVLNVIWAFLICRKKVRTRGKQNLSLTPRIAPHMKQGLKYSICIFNL